MPKTNKQLNGEIIKLENEMDELVIERNKSKDPDPYLQNEINKRMYMKKALLWALIEDDDMGLCD